MAKQTFQSNPRLLQIFEDLEEYLKFCRDYGYVYNESELYSGRSFIFRQFTKYMQGKPAKNMWDVDSKAPLQQ